MHIPCCLLGKKHFGPTQVKGTTSKFNMFLKNNNKIKKKKSAFNIITLIRITIIIITISISTKVGSSPT